MTATIKSGCRQLLCSRPHSIMSDCISPWRSCHLLACEVIAWRGSWSLCSPLFQVSGGGRETMWEKKRPLVLWLLTAFICLVLDKKNFFPPTSSSFSGGSARRVSYFQDLRVSVLHPPQEIALHWNVFSNVWYPRGFSNSQDSLQGLICKCGIFDFSSKLSRTLGWMDFEISFLREHLTFRAKEK